MLCLAGFPMIYRVGTVATIKDIGSETKDVLLLNYTLEKNMVPVVNFRNRKEISVKATSLEPVIIPNHVFDNDQFLMLLQIVKNLLQHTEGTICCYLCFMAWNLLGMKVLIFPGKCNQIRISLFSFSPSFLLLCFWGEEVFEELIRINN